MPFVFLFLGLLVAVLGFSEHYNQAAFVWAVGIAAMHAWEEYQGKLWVEFGQRDKFVKLTKLNNLWGFLLVVFPALLLQLVAAFGAFRNTDSHFFFWTSSPIFFLAMLVGASLSDALFSHILLFVTSLRPDARNLQHTNPGLPTAVIYVMNSIVFASCVAIFMPISLSQAHEAFAGFALGFLFFLCVQPSFLILGSVWQFFAR